jgi:fumarate hydratase subunit alpha
MRIINTSEVIPIIKRLAMKACYELDDNVMDSFRKAYNEEKSPLGKEIISTLIENANLAKKEQIACCQDTGVTVVYLYIGQEVCWEGQPLFDAVNEGVRQGYKDGYLRKSVLSDPILRENSNDNTPAVLYTEIVPGDKVTIKVLPKGAGSENMSRLQMLIPADGVEGIKRFVLETIELAGGKACPPLIVGVGIGGTMDKAAMLAKESLQRPIGDKNKADHLATLEEELLIEINNTGIGPLGIGGLVTALDVHVETYPCHIASLPVAVNIQCHASRHATEML